MAVIPTSTSAMSAMQVMNAITFPNNLNTRQSSVFYVVLRICQTWQNVTIGAIRHFDSIELVYVFGGTSKAMIIWVEDAFETITITLKVSHNYIQYFSRPLIQLFSSTIIVLLL